MTQSGDERGFLYERPFCPSTLPTKPCVCVVCGQHATATHEISRYPFRYTPPEWSVAARDLALRCPDCTRHNKTAPKFYEEYDVWMYEDDRYGDGKSTTQIKFIHRAQSLQVAYADPDASNIEINAVTIGGVIADLETIGVIASEETMTREQDEDEILYTRKGKLKAQAREVGGAIGAGLQLAAANEAGEVLVDIARELASDVPAVQLALESEDGREIAKLLVAMMLHTGVSQTNVIPQGRLIGKACQLQMTASSFTLLGPRLNKMRKHLTKLAKIGENVEGEYTEEEMAVADAEVAQELRSLKLRIAELEGDRVEVEEEIEVEEEVEGAAR
ncbi:MAG: hypothetical protein GY769_20100 [bacterium]|nr:hypothetical protein [bacterium]